MKLPGLRRTSALTRVGLILAGVFIFVALMAPWIAPYTYDQQDLATRLSGISSKHWMGSDELGRDIFARIVYGARVSLAVGVTVVTLSALFGLFVGSIAGYYGGWLDEVAMRTVDVLMAVPGILLAIAFVAFRGPSLENLIVALVLLGWVGYARLVRGEILKVRELDYVQAARSLGAGGPAIIVRHVLPNIIDPVIVQASLGMAGAILAEASLSFLGLGIAPPTPSWGAMLDAGRGHLFEAPHMVIFPGLAIMTVVMAFNFLGDGLRDALIKKR